MNYTPPPSSSYNHQEMELLMMAPPAAPSSTPRIGGEDDGEDNKNVNLVINIEKEHMFDKVVTPSDVGKLNRLVIPKQHAEKYFPLDSSKDEKGLLLNFEDRTGKPWRFRYSYWNSSQSYVMTKGWSRFVKEKKLDAGDIVSFQRGIGEIGKDKLFIDWRRRLPPDVVGLPFRHGRAIPGSGNPSFVLQSHPHYPYPHHPYPYPYPSHGVWRGSGLGSEGGYGFGFGDVVNNYNYNKNHISNNNNLYPMTGSLVFLRSSVSNSQSGVFNNNSHNNNNHHDYQGSESTAVMTRVQGEEGGEENMVYDSVPVVQGKAAAKRLRLFGVNMDCPISSSHQTTHDFDILSSSLASSSTTVNNHHHLRHHHHQHAVGISMGLPPSSSPPLSSPSSSNSRVVLQKGKSSTSSSMSLDLDI